MVDDEHLETDIIDDDDDDDASNLKINQINILTSQASAPQPVNRTNNTIIN